VRPLQVLMKKIVSALAPKVFLWTLLALLVAGGAVVFWAEKLRSRQEAVAERNELQLLGDALEAVFGLIEPQSNTHPVASLFERLSGRPELKRLRIFDIQGRIRWSMERAEEGRHLEKDVYRDFLLGRNIVQTTSGQRRLIRRLSLQPSCLRCHQNNAAGQLLGGFELEMAVPARQGTQLVFWLSGAVFVLALALAAALALVIRGGITLPLECIRRGLEAALEGKYASNLREGEKGEIGRLGGVANRLMKKMADLESANLDSQLVQQQAERELVLKEELEQKNRIIQETNQSLSRRLQELELLYGLSTELVGTLDAQEIFRIISERIGQSLSAEGFLFLALDEEQRRLQVVIARGVFEKLPVEKLTDAQLGLCAEAMRRRRQVYHPDLSQVRHPRGEYDNLGLSGSLVGVPLVQKNFSFGVMVFFRDRTDAFSREELRLLDSLARQASLALATSRLYQEKLDLSVTDDLTQVANRRQLFNRLEQEWNRARRFGGPLSVVMIDVDHFKIYNDRNGHLLGDRVLKEVAAVLKSSTRNVDIVARYGGEEFVVILPGQSKEAAVSVAEKLRSAIAERSFPRGYSQPLGSVTISLGVATFPQDAENPHQLLERADLALYASKSSGRNRTTAFHPELTAMEEERRRQQQSHHRPRRRRQVFLVDPT